MSDLYYYLLDGKEHGPFSRAAIESLLASGKLSGAFLRSTPDQPWQAAEELGLAAKRQPTAAPMAPKASIAVADPATVVFRSSREIEQTKSGGMAGPILAIGLFAVLIGGGVWLSTKDKNEQAIRSSDAAAVAAGATAGQLMDHSSEVAMSGRRVVGDTSAVSVPVELAVSATVAAMSPGSLRAEGSKAYDENRLYAPAGNNAIEYYLALRDKQPDDGSVSSALTDLLPLTVTATKQRIACKDLAEAKRLAALIEKIDPQHQAVSQLKASIASGDPTASAAACESPRLQPQSRQPHQEGCDYMVSEVMGEKPSPSADYLGGNTSVTAGMQQACATTYDMSARRIRIQCEHSMRLIRTMESKGMPPYLIQNEKERQIAKWYGIRGEYELRLPSYCR